MLNSIIRSYAIKYIIEIYYLQRYKDFTKLNKFLSSSQYR